MLNHEILGICQDVSSFGFPLDGILLTGSQSTGLADLDSDVDILALSHAPLEWRKFYRAGNYDVDLFVSSIKNVERLLIAHRQPIVQIVAFSTVIRDNSGATRELRRLAQEIYSIGPRAPEPTWILTQRHRLVTVLDDCASCGKANPNAALLMMCAELKLLSDMYLGTVGKWNVAEKHIFLTIAEMNLSLASLFRDVSSADLSFSDRLNAFRDLLEIVLHPFGGLLRYFETPRPSQYIDVDEWAIDDEDDVVILARGSSDDKAIAD